MNIRPFLRMAKWAHRPPGERRVKLVLGAIGLCLILLGVELFIGWPEWLTIDGAPKGRINR
ncbi:hypothetical protein [Actibacterium sp. XHP0104]|uniref:hypothetical protein n=1 Tax=Actibacterium sp. XHP0104 TaxID=2984335 RepID=UPI0014131143|nr:hypothetical protein [Actibacterium sp. XHP0104]MCV2881040.1 hypothetical protein [Actibacterium sp. XHP0104]NHX27607.1 hypothetical protein [Escherichia coli]